MAKVKDKTIELALKYQEATLEADGALNGTDGAMQRLTCIYWDQLVGALFELPECDRNCGAALLVGRGRIPNQA